MAKNTIYDEQLLLELEELLDLSKEFSDKKTVPIIYDGKQYTIKIPKKIAEKALISDELFEFTVTSRIEEGRRHSIITGKVIKR